ncbi:leucine-rich repeat-containing protein 59-like [Rhopilema esculentum]|uniref:leucine-rich repeat-containing protein 59-like n=1 Tax=Rhopilema esculentum TaxID=499914 RepID=UPI0031E3AD03|eukprot:gene13031-3805_t
MEEKSSFSKEELKRRLDGNELDLSLCSIVKVPVKQISSLPKVTVIDLSCNNIRELPDSFCTLVALTQLDLSKNDLISLPGMFGQLKNLKRLDLYNNKLVSLPLSFGDLKGLKWLDLKDNPVQTDLPDIVGDCLEPKDCENCAKRMLSFMMEMRAQEEKKKAIEAEKGRRKKAEEELETQRLLELKKKEKQEEKEKRRKAYLEEQRKKEKSQLHNDTKRKDVSKPKGDDDLNLKVVKDGPRSSSMVFLALTSFLVVIIGIFLYLYKEDKLDFVFNRK